MQTLTVNATKFIVRDDAVFNDVMNSGSFDCNAKQWFTQDGSLWAHAGSEMSNSKVLLNNWFKEDIIQFKNSLCVYIC